MKKMKFLVLIAIVAASCSKGDLGKFGDESITEDGAINASELLTMLADNDQVETKVKGDVVAVCQAKGCWMEMELDKEHSMIVKFKDYGFFVPKNSSGHSAIIEGVASIDTVSVAEQQELARDREETEEEIASITEPMIKYSFVANGVIIK